MNKQKLYFKRALLTWHQFVNKRLMPWKGVKDPYKVWLSEIILQQTRVEQGMKYYHAFLRNFPTIKDKTRRIRTWKIRRFGSILGALLGIL